MQSPDLSFKELFDGLGTQALNYSGRCADLDGKDVELKGYLSRVHDGSQDVLLVNEPGACPDCSAVPVAALLLCGFKMKKIPGEKAVKVRGTLSYGFRID